MKKLLLLFATAVLSGFSAFAQPYYFSHLQSSYMSLTTTTPVSNGVVWNDNEFVVPIGFAFMFNGNAYTNLDVESDGGIGFTGPMDAEVIAFNADLIDRGTTTSLSPISTALVGNSPNRIRIIEWKNAGFAMGDANDFVNFQVWLWEEGSRIDVRIGPSSVADIADAFDDETGPGVGLVYDGTFSGGAYSGFVLTGQANAPQALAVNNTNTDYFLDGIPSEGRVYIFTTSVLSAVDADAARALQIFPNPATDKLTISSSALLQGPAQVTVYNTVGSQLIRKTFTSETEFSLDVHTLPPGIYLIDFHCNGQRRMQQFLKQ